MITKINFHVLRAALVRDGVWIVDLRGNPVTFFHRTCWKAD